jgi:hypothetical protein
MKSFVSGNKVTATTLSALILALATVTCLQPAQAGDFAQNHPRRAEVDRRDGRLNRSLNRNHGNLGGHYGQLKQEDRSIHQQQRADAKANGGYITRTQKHQLNQEENSLRQQEHQDKK